MVNFSVDGAAISMRTAKIVSKRSANRNRVRIITSDGSHKNSSIQGCDEAITPKTSELTVEAEPLSFFLADFVEMVRTAAPLPAWRVFHATAQAVSGLPQLAAEALRPRYGRVADEMADQLNELLDRAAAHREAAIMAVIKRLAKNDLFGPLVAGLLKDATEPVEQVGRDLQRAAVVDFLIATNSLLSQLADGEWALFFSIQTVADFYTNRDGRVHRTDSNGNPVQGLTERLRVVLQDLDISRVRRCAFERCKAVFYAKRHDQLCCSRRCNNNRLQRLWYGKDREYVERVWTLCRQGKSDLAQLAQELDITMNKARGYLAAAKKRHKKERAQ